MLEKITKLIEVKKIVAILVTILFMVLSLRGDITPESSMLIVSMVITFYFNSSIEKERNKTK